MMNLDHLPKSQTVSDCLRLLGNVTGRSFLRPVDFADLQELWSWPALGRMVFKGTYTLGVVEHENLMKRKWRFLSYGGSSHPFDFRIFHYKPSSYRVSPMETPKSQETGCGMLKPCLNGTLSPCIVPPELDSWQVGRRSKWHSAGRPGKASIGGRRIKANWWESCSHLNHQSGSIIFSQSLW